VLFLSGAVWLVIGSALALISSIKFHAPQFLAGSSWLTYGRVYPASINSFLYGFCLPAGLGVGLWLIARLGHAALAQRWLVTIGAILWNLGVTVGVTAILAGDSTGFENLEMPSYAALISFLGYLLIGLWGIITFHHRRGRGLFVSQWFLFTAVFWFPWIYSTANLLLTVFPVRGVVQAVIGWWYSNNLLVVWLGSMGLAAVFYFVPKLAHRELHSHYLALFTFWMLILFASWGGIPNTAPVPAWMPAVSTVATVLTLIPILAVALNVFQTMGGDGRTATDPQPEDTGNETAQARPTQSREPILTQRRKDAETQENTEMSSSPRPSLSFILVGVVAFVIAGLMRISGVLLDPDHPLEFTWFSRAQNLLNLYGFFVMVMFGAIYHILPRLTAREFPSGKLIRLHFWLALSGILFLVVPLAVGGVIGMFQLRDTTILFIDIVRKMLIFLRISTLGDLLLLAGHLVFLCNLAGLVMRFSRARVATAYELATADLFKAAEARP
jgi:cytochrome c oxidase cbb3-type subunit 1